MQAFTTVLRQHKGQWKFWKKELKISKKKKGSIKKQFAPSLLVFDLRWQRLWPSESDATGAGSFKGPRYFSCGLIFPPEGLLSICMIIIWLSNVKQELVKVSHLQKVIDDQLRLIQSNYSSTAKGPASTADEWKIITRWSGSDMPTRCGLILIHIYTHYCNSCMSFATEANISRFGMLILINITWICRRLCFIMCSSHL